jgi:hypothetical protein
LFQHSPQNIHACINFTQAHVECRHETQTLGTWRIQEQAFGARTYNDLRSDIAPEFESQ